MTANPIAIGFVPIASDDGDSPLIANVTTRYQGAIE